MKIALKKLRLTCAEGVGFSVTVGSVIGMLTIGAAAVGALAIGALAIGKLAIKKAAVKDLQIGKLTVDRLIITNQEPTEAPVVISREPNEL